MKKPRIKREVAIESIFPQTQAIHFYASPDAAEELGEFGTTTSGGLIKNKYRLQVDARFDFDEVVEYIKNYGEAGDGP